MILEKAREMELLNKIESCFFAYESIKKLSSESRAMLQNS